jgi:2-amino-4-hydroxy-6-hydroxymethyldihydropteridine diphosphokinase
MILVAIGANLAGPDGARPLETCRMAVRALAESPDVQSVEVSRWYETAPVPPSDQPNYVNGVARLTFRPPGDLTGGPTATVSPESLLAMLQEIEARFGRARSEANAARTLDLDLIDMDGLVRDAPDPILPHPRAHLRAFVLLPLLDVAPDWVHPRNGRTARRLQEELGQAGVRVLDVLEDGEDGAPASRGPDQH